MRSRDTIVRLARFRVEEKRRQVQDIDAMIQDFLHKYDDLDQTVKFEESRTGITDPNHFNYSTAAKATRVRRDNLMKSIGELKDQLADAQAALDDSERELRKAELLAEKDAGATAAVPAVEAAAAPMLAR
jgi:flagellar export protein FliJ